MDKKDILKGIIECSPDAVSLAQALAFSGYKPKEAWKPVYRVAYYVDNVLQHETKWVAGHPTKEMREMAKERDLEESIISGKYHLTIFDHSFKSPNGEILGDDTEGIWLDA